MDVILLGPDPGPVFSVESYPDPVNSSPNSQLCIYDSKYLNTMKRRKKHDQLIKHYTITSFPFIDVGQL